jgi:hypothetical protein
MSEIIQITITHGLVVKVTLSDLILFVTFLALLWYSLETRRMRKEIGYQNKISTMPNLNFYMDTTENQFYLENYSRFPAFKLTIAEKQMDKHFKFVFEQVNSVLPGQRKAFSVRILKEQKEIIDEKEHFDFFKELIEKRLSIFDFETSATYINNMGRKYKTTLRCGTGWKSINGPFDNRSWSVPL